MPKDRLSINKGLPKRWTFKNNAYRYYVPKGLEGAWDGKKLFTLGKTLPEAYKTWSDRMETPDKINTFSQLMERYLLEVAPQKAIKTHKQNQAQSKRLLPIFGTMSPGEIKPQHVYKYYDKRDAKVSAKREIALLSHCLTKAVEWGIINHHPFKGEVRLKGEKPRDRYIQDWELEACLSLEKLPFCRTKLMQSFMVFAIFTGLRKQDILCLKTSDITDEGITVKTKKTGKAIEIEMTDSLRAVTQDLLDQRPVDISPYVICSKRGKSYYNLEIMTCSGFDSIWSRFMDRCIAETALKERFTIHDLRAKSASDSKNEEEARVRLGHANINMTRKTYIRKPQKVRPLR